MQPVKAEPVSKDHEVEVSTVEMLDDIQFAVKGAHTPSNTPPPTPLFTPSPTARQMAEQGVRLKCQSEGVDYVPTDYCISCTVLYDDAVAVADCRHPLLHAGDNELVEPMIELCRYCKTTHSLLRDLCKRFIDGEPCASCKKWHAYSCGECDPTLCRTGICEYCNATHIYEHKHCKFFSKGAKCFACHKKHPYRPVCNPASPMPSYSRQEVHQDRETCAYCLSKHPPAVEYCLRDKQLACKTCHIMHDWAFICPTFDDKTCAFCQTSHRPLADFCPRDKTLDCLACGQNHAWAFICLLANFGVEGDVPTGPPPIGDPPVDHFLPNGYDPAQDLPPRPASSDNSSDNEPLKAKQIRLAVSPRPRADNVQLPDKIKSAKINFNLGNKQRLQLTPSRKRSPSAAALKRLRQTHKRKVSLPKPKPKKRRLNSLKRWYERKCAKPAKRRLRVSIRVRARSPSPPRRSQSLPEWPKPIVTIRHEDRTFAENARYIESRGDQPRLRHANPPPAAAAGVRPTQRQSRKDKFQENDRQIMIFVLVLLGAVVHAAGCPVICKCDNFIQQVVCTPGYSRSDWIHLRCRFAVSEPVETTCPKGTARLSVVTEAPPAPPIITRPRWIPAYATKPVPEQRHEVEVTPPSITRPKWRSAYATKPIPERRLDVEVTVPTDHDIVRYRNEPVRVPELTTQLISPALAALELSFFDDMINVKIFSAVGTVVGLLLIILLIACIFYCRRKFNIKSNSPAKASFGINYGAFQNGGPPGGLTARLINGCIALAQHARLFQHRPTPTSNDPWQAFNSPASVIPKKSPLPTHSRDPKHPIPMGWQTFNSPPPTHVRDPKHPIPMGFPIQSDTQNPPSADIPNSSSTKISLQPDGQSALNDILNRPENAKVKAKLARKQQQLAERERAMAVASISNELISVANQHAKELYESKSPNAISKLLSKITKGGVKLADIHAADHDLNKSAQLPILSVEDETTTPDKSAYSAHRFAQNLCRFENNIGRFDDSFSDVYLTPMAKSPHHKRSVDNLLMITPKALSFESPKVLRRAPSAPGLSLYPSLETDHNQSFGLLETDFAHALQVAAANKLQPPGGNQDGVQVGGQGGNSGQVDGENGGQVGGQEGGGQEGGQGDGLNKDGGGQGDGGHPPLVDLALATLLLTPPIEDVPAPPIVEVPPAPPEVPVQEVPPAPLEVREEVPPAPPEDTVVLPEVTEPRDKVPAMPNDPEATVQDETAPEATAQDETTPKAQDEVPPVPEVKAQDETPAPPEDTAPPKATVQDNVPPAPPNDLDVAAQKNAEEFGKNKKPKKSNNFTLVTESNILKGDSRRSCTKKSNGV